MPQIAGMTSDNPKHRYAVELKRGPRFEVEVYSGTARTRVKNLAMSFCMENPDWVRVIDRKQGGAVIYAWEEIQQVDAAYCRKHGITVSTFVVSVELMREGIRVMVVPVV